MPNLLAAVHAGICPRGLYEAAVRENPKVIAELRKAIGKAAKWELKRYGCLLL